MEEDLGAGSSALSGEFLAESMGGENRLEESYDGVDEGEIMVEVVGSDVFVNGVSGHNGDLEGLAWEEREGSQNFSEALDIWSVRDRNKMGASEVGFSESRGVGVLGDEVWNPGIEAMVVPSSAVIESVMEQTEEVMARTFVVISEENLVKYEAVKKGSANAMTSELSSHPVEAVVGGNVGMSGKEEMLTSSGNDADNVQVGGVDDTVESGLVNVTDNLKDEYLKNGGEVETDMAHQNHPFSNKPTQQPYGGDMAEMSEAKGMNVEIQTDTEENQPSTMMLNSPGGRGNLRKDSSKLVDDPHIATSMGEVVFQEVVISQVKAVNGDRSVEKDKDPGRSEMPALDVSSGSMHLSANGSHSKVEMADVKVAEPHVVCNDPIVDAEVELDIVVEECESCKSNEIEVAVQISETVKIPIQLSEESNHGVGKLAGVNLMPNEAASVPTASVTNSSEDNGSYLVEGRTCEMKLTDVDQERESDRKYDGRLVVDCREAELATEERASETDKFNLSNEETVKSASLVRMYQPGYLSSPENEGHFAPSDLVWGKVRNRPWWPGQIFDQADSSEKAIKYYRDDSYLVAYFGDQTFAWNSASDLKPLMPYFSQIEMQSNSEAFQNAVNSALEEVSRRVELGLACSCIPKDAYIKIGTQVIENAGIREESSRRCGVHYSSRATSFEPDKLLEYVSNLAPCASSGADQLDLVIARAQLFAFCRFKGCHLPTEFSSSGELLGNDTDPELVSNEIVVSHRRRCTPWDVSHSRKERSLTELMGGQNYSTDAEHLDKSVSFSSRRKCKALDPLANGSDKWLSIHAAKFSTRMSHTPKPSFKVGECILRAAHVFPKIYERSEKQSAVVSAESFSVIEMLSQLELLAQDPEKGQNIQKNINSFFLGFRSSIVLNRQGTKRKVEPTIGASGEEFAFDDANDPYRKDRIIQRYSAEQLRHDWENRTGNLQPVLLGAERYSETGRKLRSRKRFSTRNYPTAATESDDNVKRQKHESSPAELILNFAERKCVPSEINLNKIFRRFGPLMESETEVDHDSGRAKVIFKRDSDAEVARSSAEEFKIFGPVLVDYQIGYSPLISVKILPLAVPQWPEDETWML